MSSEEVTPSFNMAKKLLYNRAVASKVYWPAVFEDISDDEDSCDFQPLDYSTSPKFKYQGSVTSADSSFLLDLSRKTEENVNIKVEKIENVNTVIKEEPVEENEEQKNEDLEEEKEVRSEVDERLLMEWSEDSANSSNDEENTFNTLLDTATFVMDCQVQQDFPPSVTPEKSTKSPRKSPKSKERSIEQFNCQFCSRKYWKKSKLAAHIKTKHDLKEKKEDKLAKSPEDKRNLVSKCPDCQVQLENKTQMYVHRLTHILPSFSLMRCPLCSENQYSLNNMKTHMKTVHHLQEKWFCPVCPDGRTFTQNHSLLAHIATFHFDTTKTAPTQYKCDKCHNSFTSKALLGRHLQNDHGGLIDNNVKKPKQLACYVCQKKMEDLTQLRRHLINHTEHKFGRQSPKIKKEEFTAKFLEFSKRRYKASKPSFSISSILSKA